MKPFFLFAIMTLSFISCDQPHPEVNTKEIKLDSLIETDNHFLTTEKANLALNEIDLNKDTTGIIETRFYFFQPYWGGLYEFYKIKYADSTLHLKQFTLTDPAGHGSDSVYSTKNIKLTKENLAEIKSLIDKSMFWSLNSDVESNPHFDGHTYIYESVRNQNAGTPNSYLQHHRVYSAHPTNFDFMNFRAILKIFGRTK